MHERNKILAHFNFSVHKKNTTINNMEVYYKNKGIGSIILKDIEKYVSKNHDVKKINLCAWQESGGDNLLHFFTKNGYSFINNKSAIYDDTLYIYDLYQFEKYI